MLLRYWWEWQSELGAETGVKVYDDIKELTTIGVCQLDFIAMLSPELARNARNNLNPKPASTASIAQRALLPKIRKIMDDWTPEDKEAFNRLTREEKQIYLEAISSEEEITESLKQIVLKNGGHLEGLENRIKSPSSLFEKIYLRSEPISISEVKDIVRYTEIQSPENLVSGVQSTLKDLEEGYQILKLNNKWLDNFDPYNGVNVQIKAPNGQIFELQFHTPESFELKNGVLHDLYELKRCTKNIDLLIELNEKMHELSEALQRPNGIEELKNRP